MSLCVLLQTGVYTRGTESVRLCVLNGSVSPFLFSPPYTDRLSYTPIFSHCFLEKPLPCQVIELVSLSIRLDVYTILTVLYLCVSLCVYLCLF